MLQAFQIATLIKEYTEVLQTSHDVRRRDVNGKKKNENNRPVSILHKPAPVLESHLS